MTHYQLVAANKRRSLLVVTGFMAFIVLLSYMMITVLGYGLDMLGVALIVSGFVSFGSYWYSDKIVLSMSGAKPASRQEFFDFYTVAENIAASQRLPLPKLYVIQDTAMNAFATGRDPDHAAVVATTGLLSRLNRSEVEAVVAHELAHVQNYDIRLMSIVSILVGFVALISDWFLRWSFLGNRRDSNDRSSGQIGAILAIVGIVLVLLSPIIANLIKLVISRKREFLADASAIAMTRNPNGLIAALSKLEGDREPLEAANKATAHLYITNPLRNHHDAVGWFSNLFNTHPPIQERIAALQSIAT